MAPMKVCLVLTVYHFFNSKIIFVNYTNLGPDKPSLMPFIKFPKLLTRYLILCRQEFAGKKFR